MPEELPDQGDRRVVFFDPPPPPPPPLPKGSPLQPAAGEAGDAEARHREQAEAGVHRPDRDAPAAGDGASSSRRRASGPRTSSAARPGATSGTRSGWRKGVEGGVVGGVPGGVLGGVLGGTGTGPVMDYDSAPRPIKITRPQYPQEAFVKKIEGTVVVEILIDSQGRVVRARVIQSVPLLDAAALQTVYQWVFQPAVKHGRPGRHDRPRPRRLPHLLAAWGVLRRTPQPTRLGRAAEPAASPREPRALVPRNRPPDRCPRLSRWRRRRSFLPERPEGTRVLTPREGRG